VNRIAAYLSVLLFVATNRFEGRRERGATAVEYGLLVGLIAVAIIVAVTALGTKLTGLFDGVTVKVPTP